MVETIVLHALVGVALAALVWAVGFGIVRGRLARVHAYPFGLLAVTAAAVLFLAAPWLGLAGLVLLAPALRARRVPGLLTATLAGAGLPVALGLLEHGPTATRDSTAYGDMLFYAARTVSASQSILPLHDLLVAGEHGTYVEGGTTFLGAPFLHVGADPILLQTTTFSAFLLAAITIGLRVLDTRVPRRAAVVLALLGLAIVAYPTWIAESPPVALALPLAFSAFALWREPLGPRALGVVGGAIAVDAALSKAFAVLPLGVLLAAGLRRVGRRQLLVYGGAAALLAFALLGFSLGTSGWLTRVFHLKFLPADALRGLHSQLETRSTQQVAPALLVTGQVVLAVALARARQWTLLAALAVSLVGNWVIGGHGFDVTVGISVLLAFLLFRAEPQLSSRALAAAALLLAGSTWFRETAGVRDALVLLLLLGAALLLVLRARALAVALAVTGLALGVGGLWQRNVTLTPDNYAVWHRVHELVPRSSLVYTSMTGPVIDGDHGWNYYPGLAGRQLYLAGWSDSPLLVRRGELARRLARNTAVLSGRRPASGYTVIRRGESHPPGWRLVYENSSFALLRLP